MATGVSGQGRLPSVTVVTHSPSPYQVELFDAIARSGRLELSVIYLYAKDAQRLWQSPTPFHESVTLTQDGGLQSHVLAQTDHADLVVINYYKHPLARALMHRRSRSGSAMCFWGERPQHAPLPWLSRMVRRWRLRPLLRSNSPVWGIGTMAVDAYNREFGGGRVYVNLPYFSDLGRFHRAARDRKDGTRVFLFSGALSHRKGADLLAAAFARLAPEHPNVRLRVMGAGALEPLMRERLQGCMDRVEFIGFRDWNELPQGYSEADVLCVPSRHDGWGLVVPEGLAAGLPVIGTRQTGAAVEFVNHGANGWLLPSANEDLLYAAMTGAAALSGTELGIMSTRARESVAAHSLEHGAERFADAAGAAIAACNASQGKGAIAATT